VGGVVLPFSTDVNFYYLEFVDCIIMSPLRLVYIVILLLFSVIPLQNMEFLVGAFMIQFVAGGGLGGFEFYADVDVRVCICFELDVGVQFLLIFVQQPIELLLGDHEVFGQVEALSASAGTQHLTNLTLHT